jgi:hypothetical protein
MAVPDGFFKPIAKRPVAAKGTTFWGRGRLYIIRALSTPGSCPTLQKLRETSAAGAEHRQTRTPHVTHHHLKAGPATCHWGYFDAKQKPVLTVQSGDEVTIDCVSGHPEILPDPDKFHIPSELKDIHARSERGPGPHILTGPIFVQGATPGHVLEVRILDVQLRQDWGYNVIRPLAGALPDDFDEPRSIIIPLDKARMVGALPWGLELKLAPFFGVMGVAPPPAWGRITSIVPRAMAAISTTRNLAPVRPFTFRSFAKAPCSHAAMATACRATAKSV